MLSFILLLAQISAALPSFSSVVIPKANSLLSTTRQHSCNSTVITSLESAYCIDKREDDIVGLECGNDTYTESPPVFTINKCCHEGWYDPQQRICQNTTDGTSFPEDIIVGNISCFINIVHGLKQCSPGKVVVDILVNLEDISLFNNGSLLLNSSLLDTYCLDNTVNGKMIVKACLDAEKECSHRSCVQKCCQDGYGMIFERSCEPSKFDFNPQFHHLAEVVNYIGPSFGILSNFSCKNDKFVLLPKTFDEDKNYLQVGGTLYVPAYKQLSNFSREQYCLERVLVPDNGMDGIYAFLCFPEDEPEELSLQFLLLSLGLIISSIFLLLTFLVYACLPSLQNLHGKTLMCHVASLFAAYVCLSMGQLGTYNFSIGVCATIGYCILFTFLASFSWLNVMCFDIWWTFGAVRSLRQSSGSRKQRERRRFLFYSMYAWGVPSALTAISIVMDVLDDVSPPDLKPAMGEGPLLVLK
ncbi:hypothetical protein L9F63_015568 [Diploptera punctata]|uniref:G-protein coupled receptors family 2 profile 2 domain-containing protein n=1 Tax=Diploptera punctata TaxID=6984 RepID=A0AAD8A530_DIPPU|nr:hypothetical protein L9F63_015568 [Diploptera punctata]